MVGLSYCQKEIWTSLVHTVEETALVDIEVTSTIKLKQNLFHTVVNLTKLYHKRPLHWKVDNITCRQPIKSKQHANIISTSAKPRVQSTSWTSQACQFLHQDILIYNLFMNKTDAKVKYRTLHKLEAQAGSSVLFYWNKWAPFELTTLLY
jgi:hypothetical protein